MNIGARFLDNGGIEFILWAPLLNKVELKIVSPEQQLIPMVKDENGYWKAELKSLSSNATYLYRLEGNKERPDPASFFQPKGVHKPSKIVNHNSFIWQDQDWRGIDLSRMIIYELHVGTFTAKGDFDSIHKKLNYLSDLGVNTIEIMPVAQFPGSRNWGYDGVYPFSVQNSYGGPDALKRLINECHRRKIAVILDVVYNHLGPEGNYLMDLGPYFTNKYVTPWGNAINFDDVYNEGVRNYFIENALYWFRNYHADALRLDAIHGIFDISEKHFLKELGESVEKYSAGQNRMVYLIAESDLNDAKVITPRNKGGYGIDAQWNDDFHHSIHALITDERKGYYSDFGSVKQLEKSFNEGYVFSGQYSNYRKRNHGNSSRNRTANQFVVFSQNHDQVGNRLMGDRLISLAGFEGAKLAAGSVILAPYMPLLFMGEEYGEQRPFLYFVSHTDKSLIKAVRKGRSEEFKAFDWKGKLPDPQSNKTFLRSKLNWGKINQRKRKILLQFYKEIISLRKSLPALLQLDRSKQEVKGFENKKILIMKRWNDSCFTICIYNFSNQISEIEYNFVGGSWKKMLDSSETKWNGPGTQIPDIIENNSRISLKPASFCLFKKEEN
ncbi:MAG: malto-oligosyltrehalose trehalohydrolase [bacterium]